MFNNNLNKDIITKIYIIEFIFSYVIIDVIHIIGKENTIRFSFFE
jgi:hypothetical protein